MKKRFIEYDLPLAEISEQSAREKNIRHGHPSTLHIWWARRPLAASRATAFAALIDDPGPHDPKKRREIRQLIEQITPWEAVKNGNNKAIEKAQEPIREQYGDEPPKVLDPFSGGGSIPLEALRLGCETYASDYNPVAVFIEKATLEWPQKYGVQVQLPKGADDGGLGLGAKKVNLPAYLVEKWANVILEEARSEIGRFYPEEKGLGLVGKRDITEADGWIPVGYLWARTIPCQNPTCGAGIPLFRQTWLAKKANKTIAYRPVVDREAKRVAFELLEGKALKAAMEDGFDPSEGTVSRGDASCPVCGQVTKAKQTRKLARQGKMAEGMVAVVLHHPKETGKKYRIATGDDMRVYEEARAHLDEKVSNWPYLESPLPEDYLSKRFRHYRQKAGLPRDINFHSLRHTFASWAVMRGMDLYRLKEIMGHSDIQVTMRYAHLRPDATRQDMERFFGDGRQETLQEENQRLRAENEKLRRELARLQATHA